MKTKKEITFRRNQQMEIKLQVVDLKSLKAIDFHFKHTRHSFRRAAQRGINLNKITATLQYGENIFKQGLIYFILGENNIPDSLSKEKNKLKNTVVVVAGDSNEVITCYRSSNPFKKIKIKSKQLNKKYINAA
jgi:MFS superfamily sulfate permease-like transporter